MPAAQAQKKTANEWPCNWRNNSWHRRRRHGNLELIATNGMNQRRLHHRRQDARANALQRPKEDHGKEALGQPDQGRASAKNPQPEKPHRTAAIPPGRPGTDRHRAGGRKRIACGKPLKRRNSNTKCLGKIWQGNADNRRVQKWKTNPDNKGKNRLSLRRRQARCRQRRSLTGGFAHTHDLSSLFHVRRMPQETGHRLVAC
jgi:hypothetical protein